MIVRAIFDTGNESNSVLSCKRFPGIPRIPIRVDEATIRYFNDNVASMYDISYVEGDISMKDLYKICQGKIPNDQYIDVMKALGFKFVQGVSGSLSIINLEIASIEFHIGGVPFKFRANLYCTYSVDTPYDVLFSAKYIASLLDRHIVISPRSDTKHLYSEIASLSKEIKALTMINRRALTPDMQRIRLIMQSKKKLDELYSRRFDAKMVTIS